VSPQDSPSEVAHSDRAPILATTAAAGTAASKEVVDVWCPTPESIVVTSPMMGKVAIESPVTPIGPSIGASSLHPQTGAATALAIADDDIVEEPEVALGHPLLRAPGDVSLDEAMGMAH
jgi:hypothetical protein